MTTSSPASERQPFQSGFRRSVTLPARVLSVHEKAALDPSDAAADILYSHPSARIIKFTPPTTAIKSASGPPSHDLDYPVDAIETLPWASTTETIAASGPMIIEKVRGSTYFLKSREVTHAILRNSQCWCVDGASKFVLRIKRFEYYRIELPNKSEDERKKVEEFKGVLSNILRFEKTPCPFKRGFQVELTELTLTPRRKGTWKRRQSSLASVASETPSPRPGGASYTSRNWQRPGSDHSTESNEHDEQRNGADSDSNENQTHSDAGGSSDEANSVSERAQTLETNAGRPEDLPHDIAQEKGDSELDSNTAGHEAELQHESKLEPPGVAETPDQDIIDRDISEVRSESPEPATGNTLAVSEGNTIGDLGHLAATSHPEPEDLSASQDFATNFEDPINKDVEDGLEKTISHEEPPELQNVDAISIASSMHSFHSVAEPDDQDAVHHLSPSFGYSRHITSPTPLAEPVNLFDPSRPGTHKREISEITVTASSPELGELTRYETTPEGRPSSSASEQPTTPLLIRSSGSDISWPDVQTPGYPPTTQLRHRLRARRSLSPMPPASIVFTPPIRYQNNHFSSTILQTAATVVSKPIELVLLILHVLVRVAGGATVNDLISGDLFRRPGQGQDHRRNSSLPDQMGEREDDSLDEDDFGVPIRGRVKSADRGKSENDSDSLFDLD